MFVARNGHWTEALRDTLRRVHDPTTRQPVPWFLSGEAAPALQGAHIEPQLIEFRAISTVAAVYFAQLMRPFEAPIHSAVIVYRRGGNLAPSDNWRSNVHQRIVGWSSGGRATWLGRWIVGGMRVQVSYVQTVHIDPAGEGMRAPLRRAAFEGTEVPVVPLEYHLAESAMHNDTQTTHRILNAMRTSGYDAGYLQNALSLLPAERASRLTRLLELTPIAG